MYGRMMLIFKKWTAILNNTLRKRIKIVDVLIELKKNFEHFSGRRKLK